MQIKIIMQYQLIPNRKATIKKQKQKKPLKITNVYKGLQKLELLCIICGIMV